MLKNYIKIAFKVMLRKKYYTFLALVGISFTIMIISIAAAFIDQLIGSNPSEPNRNRTLIMKEVFLIRDNDFQLGPSLSLDFVKRYLITLETPEKVSFYKDEKYVSVQNKIQRTHKLKCTDENFWSITDFKFVEGKAFDIREIRNASRVAVITEDLKNYYFDDLPAVGKPIVMYGNKFIVIGVVKSAPLFSDASSDAWIPYTADPAPIRVDDAWPQFWGSYKTMILAHSTDDFKAIRHELNTQMKKIVLPNQEIVSVSVPALTTLQQFAKAARARSPDPDPSNGRMYSALISSLILFLIIPVISLVNLNISRIAERSAEIGIRKSFGATSATLVGQFIVENILLTFVGGMIGLSLAFIVSDGLIYILNTFDPMYKMSTGQFILSWRVFTFCIACCILFGFLSGVYPAFRMSRMHPVKALKGENL